MDLKKLGIWYRADSSNQGKGEFPLTNLGIVIYDKVTGEPYKRATRCVIELGVSGAPEVVGLEAIDLDENGNERRVNGQSQTVSYGLLAGQPLRTSADIRADEREQRERSAERRERSAERQRADHRDIQTLGRLAAIERAILQPKGFWALVDRFVWWWRS